MQLEHAFNDNRRFLWSLSYRMTGSAADADDVLQETFVRALQNPPRNTDDPLRPWLATVAVNLSRDVLRRRKRQNYVGQWLPSPIDTENNDVDLAAFEAEDDGSATSDNPGTRYEMLESVSFAFLLALEALTPNQRAVLLLRDVFDHTVAETAAVLKISEQNVKTTHHRARKAMADYERRRLRPRKSLVQKTEKIVAQLVNFLLAHDAESAARLLSGSAVSISDGGGQFVAARVPIVGPEKIALFMKNLFKGAADLNVTTRPMTLNGHYGFWAESRDGAPAGYASRLAILFEPGEGYVIERVYFVLAPRKLTALADQSE
jgi:RNA polymerase sigma-70 factor (ECF subfamily)